MLLMAAASHGPGEHGLVVNVILVLVVVSALCAGLVRVLRSRKRSSQRSEHDQGLGA